MEKALTICIPAYNEKRCIGTTLESALDQTFKGKKEILVGANGCTDQTASIVRRYSDKYSEVKLVEIAEQGKPNTWNILRGMAQNNLIIFGDGDVHFDREAFAYLHDALSNGDKIAYGGRAVPYLEKVDWLTKLLNFPAKTPKSCMWGCLYGINNTRTQQALEAKGFTQMPKDIIPEDFWLSLVIGNENWTIKEEAKVYYVPSKWSEALRVEKRTLRGKQQLAREYPDLWKASLYRSSLYQKARIFSEIPGKKEKAAVLLRFLFKSIVMKYIECTIAGEKLENPLEGWEISEHSKQPIRR